MTVTNPLHAVSLERETKWTHERKPSDNISFIACATEGIFISMQDCHRGQKIDPL